MSTRTQVNATTPFELELAHLESLGFNERVQNLFLLRKTNGNVDVVARLLDAKRRMAEAVRDGQKEKNAMKSETRYLKKHCHAQKEALKSEFNGQESDKIEKKKLKKEINLAEKTEEKERKLLRKLAKKHGLNFHDSEDSDSSDDEKSIKKQEKKAAKHLKKQEMKAVKRQEKIAKKAEQSDSSCSSFDEDEKEIKLNKRQLKIQRIEKRLNFIQDPNFKKFSPEKKDFKIEMLERKLNKLKNLEEKSPKSDDSNSSSTDDDCKLNKKQLKIRRIERRLSFIKDPNFKKMNPEKKDFKIAKLERKLNKLKNQESDSESSDVEKSLNKEKRKAMKHFIKQAKLEEKYLAKHQKSVSKNLNNQQSDILKSAEQVFLDGNNLLYVIGALRSSILTGNLVDSQRSLEELAKSWLAQNPQLFMCSLIFEEMKNSKVEGHLKVSGIGSNYQSLDIALIDWCLNSTVELSKIVVFTNDKSLIQELTKLGITVHKANKWFEIAAMALNRGDDLLDNEDFILQWFEQTSVCN